jgi:6-phosphofructokinase 1
LPNEKFITYAQPLIQGELHLPTEQGLPVFARLKRARVEKVLPRLG